MALDDIFVILKCALACCPVVLIVVVGCLAQKVLYCQHISKSFQC